MPVDEGRKRHQTRDIARRDIVRGEIAGRDVAVKTAEQLLECVGKALVVPAGIIGDRPGGRAEQSRIAEQDLVGRVAAADPQFVRPLAVPSQGFICQGDLETQTILPPGRHLGN